MKFRFLVTTGHQHTKLSSFPHDPQQKSAAIVGLFKNLLINLNNALRNSFNSLNQIDS